MKNQFFVKATPIDVVRAVKHAFAAPVLRIVSAMRTRSPQSEARPDVRLADRSRNVERLLAVHALPLCSGATSSERREAHLSYIHHPRIKDCLLTYIQPALEGVRSFLNAEETFTDSLCWTILLSCRTQPVVLRASSSEPVQSRRAFPNRPGRPPAASGHGRKRVGIPSKVGAGAATTRN